ncbi:MAG: hypothetical protein GXP63_00425 [DPANN group archaeon]|nr:hypothetical protein [DPANN group archaeon]
MNTLSKKKGRIAHRKMSRSKKMETDPPKQRMTTSFVSNVISEIVGEDVLPVVDYLKNKKEISEFQIAEKIRLEVNTIRNILYRLHNHGLVNYIRRKDKIKGWYISYWTLDLKETRHIYDKRHREMLENLKERLYREELNRNSFFMCKNFCARVDFETASDLFFKCPECGQLLEQQDNTKTIENIKRKISELEIAM